jgi:uncharacterized membrane-anchored protein
VRVLALLCSRFKGDRGQTTAEYALVIVAAAAIALVLLAWARSSDTLPAFFDAVIDRIVEQDTSE